MVLDHPFPPDARVENEAVSLVEAGFEVTVLSVGPDERPATETYRGIRVVRHRISEGWRNKMRGLAGTVPLLRAFLKRVLVRQHAARPFDALHMHDLYLFGGGLAAGTVLKVPVVGDLHENWVEALKNYRWSTTFPGNLVVSIPRWERIEHRWVNAVDRLVVVIEEAAERNEALGVPPERITVVPNTINRAAFDGFEEDVELMERVRSPLTITYTGGIDDHRGLHAVIDAFPAVRDVHPEARLVIVGEGRIRPELEQRAAALGLGACVWFEGWQPQRRLKSYILASDLCLVPHLKTAHTDATIPHKLFHYMYLERPVAVSNCRPLERIVRETGAGAVFEAGRADVLAETLLALAADPEEARAMGVRGRRAVLDRYHWEATVQDLIAMYRELAAGRRAAP